MACHAAQHVPVPHVVGQAPERGEDGQEVDALLQKCSDRRGDQPERGDSHERDGSPHTCPDALKRNVDGLAPDRDGRRDARNVIDQHHDIS